MYHLQGRGEDGAGRELRGGFRWGVTAGRTGSGTTDQDQESDLDKEADLNVEAAEEQDHDHGLA